MELNEALDLISEQLGTTVEEVLTDGLPDGAYEDSGFDEQLVRDTGKAVQRWMYRIGKQ